MQGHSCDTSTQHAAHNDRIPDGFSDRVARNSEETECNRVFLTLQSWSNRHFSQRQHNHVGDILHTAAGRTENSVATLPIFHYDSAESSAVNHQTVSAKSPHSHKRFHQLHECSGVLVYVLIYSAREETPSSCDRWRKRGRLCFIGSDHRQLNPWLFGTVHTGRFY